MTLLRDLDESFADLLPSDVQTVAQLIGLPRAMHLVEAFGGSYCYIPQPARCKVGHPLERLIGLAALKALASEFPGQPLHLPRCVAALRAVRDQQIRTSTESQRELALAYGLTERQIRNIQHNSNEDEHQQGLFGTDF